ncbi:MAG TPA: shikimate kinase [Granulicella sp.]|jgi:shikimate kinase|nr:shikimate kinase [Granulicella sp.]
MQTIQTNQTIQTEAEAPAQPHPAEQPPASLRRLVLAGFMGAGKTTVGRLLAARLGWTFLDLDAHLEERAGLRVPEIFARHGEAHFRRLESSALASALGRSQIVLALGGGTPETLTNRLLLEQTPGTTTLFLDAPFPTLFDRCVLQEIDRPVLADPALAEARFRARQPLYRRLARHTVDTANLTPEQTVQQFLTVLYRTS